MEIGVSAHELLHLRVPSRVEDSLGKKGEDSKKTLKHIKGQSFASKKRGGARPHTLENSGTDARRKAKEFGTKQSEKPPQGRETWNQKSQDAGGALNSKGKEK